LSIEANVFIELTTKVDHNELRFGSGVNTQGVLNLIAG
jgi:hypothetical protein